GHARDSPGGTPGGIAGVSPGRRLALALASASPRSGHAASRGGAARFAHFEHSASPRPLRLRTPATHTAPRRVGDDPPAREPHPPRAAFAAPRFQRAASDARRDAPAAASSGVGSDHGLSDLAGVGASQLPASSHDQPVPAGPR